MGMRGGPGAWIGCGACKAKAVYQSTVRPPRRALPHYNLPRLPSGYFGRFTIACIPPLWRRVMDGRLLGVVGRNASRINLDPRQREALIRRHGLRDAPAATD